MIIRYLGSPSPSLMIRYPVSPSLIIRYLVSPNLTRLESKVLSLKILMNLNLFFGMGLIVALCGREGGREGVNLLSLKMPTDQILSSYKD